MSLSEEIDAAIRSHAVWRERLESAIKRGNSVFNVAALSADDRCEFGLWLKALIEDGKGRGPHFERVRLIHRDFHRLAGQVLTHATTGRQAQALELMGGEYERASAELIDTLNEWRLEEVS